MKEKIKEVSNFQELIAAVSSPVKEVVIKRSILCLYSFLLGDGVTLRGKRQENEELPLLSFPYGDGIGLSANTSVQDIILHAPVDHRALFLAESRNNLGRLHFDNITMTGQFSLIFRQGVQTASVSINDLDIIASDSRHYLEQPQKYGVNVLQGAFTLYNFNSDPESVVRVTAKQLRIGRKNAPVVGSGVFIAGFGDKGGRVEVDQLHTHAVYSTGKIPFGSPDFITAAVFILNGAKVKNSIHDGELVTYGVNDMVLDAWGEVEDWTCNAPIISYGPSGIGFVNFGTVKRLTANAPLETYGLGARGYNQYDGTIGEAVFESITTYGDGSIGIQISKKIGSITVRKDITTHGGIGNSLVKGVNMQLPASAVSIKAGGEVEKISVQGNIQTFGDYITTYSVEDGGVVEAMQVRGKLTAGGRNAKAVSLSPMARASVAGLRYD